MTAEVRALITSVAQGVQHLADNDSLFETGRIDSLTFLRILSALEERYAISLSDADLALSDLSSIEAIAAYVAARRDLHVHSG
jgi:acyl carrier protein